MSDEQAEQEQRTEDPSERRLSTAFEQGDLALSREVVSTAAFLGGVITLASLAPSLEHQLTRVLAHTLALASKPSFDALPSLLVPMATSILAVICAIAAGAVVSTFGMTRGYLWGEKAMPDLDRVFSLERLTRIFSKEFAVDLLVGLVKVVAVGVVTWGVVRADFLTLNRISFAGPADQLVALFGSVLKIAVRAAGLFIVFSGADFALTRLRYRKRHMMTKEELRREMREDEGDPMIRGARKRRHRELVKRNALSDTKRADALIVNPTHIAVAVRYRKAENAAPVILAKGKGVLAEAMRETARENGIPIVQDIPLARLLYRKVKSGGQVPAETFKAVATILAFVYRMTGRSPSVQREAQQ
jgi:flagellar biosynthesis protein FlhB